MRERKDSSGMPLAFAGNALLTMVSVPGCGDLNVSIPKVSIKDAYMSILKVSIRQIKAARALLDWSQSDLAAASGVSEPTIKRLESASGELGGRSDTTEKIVAALEAAGVTFIATGDVAQGVGVTLKG